ncbi:ABC transporter ATP-binding protein [Acinetobacter baumannii]|uniref:ABC transporter ATP-binding protein n=1 Tax=Acinetobacter baumannii TaxID=470 RepID=UPI002340ECE7|nr:ABC transporter ATP-binding protein [Acinetobacter baumannii]MDC4919645.1 ABC transporter ATP-binding protein [Acinetobacter baumannii]MDC4934125.1 ABC transporter ATP-binding protein [Acinetobacter baumannii]MDC5521381.1 ABC transporter ATP-binding protein [Acinetobacter baumannii]
MSEVLLTAKNVWKSYKNIQALQDFSITVQKGEIIGIVGPNGAGKTTLMECFQGLNTFDLGFISLFGEDIRHGLSSEIRQKIGVAPQFFSLPPLLTVIEILTLYGSLYVNSKQPDEVISLVGLEDEVNMRFSRLSGGQQRRLALAISLIGQPELLFLDEPTGDIDPQNRRCIWDILLDKNLLGERSVIITTHQMDEVEALCSKVVILDKGCILEQGTPQELIARHCPEHFIRFEIDEFFFGEVKECLRNLDFESEILNQNIVQIKIRSLIVKDILKIVSQFESKSIIVNNLQISKSSLEDVFIKLTGKVLRK